MSIDEPTYRGGSCLNNNAFWYWDPEIISLIIQIISLVRSMDLDSQPRPKSKLMSLVTQTLTIDFDSQPKPLWELISLITEHGNSQDSDFDWELRSLMVQTLELEPEPEPELMSIIHQMVSLLVSTNSKLRKLISLSPHVEVILKNGIFHVGEQVKQRSNNKWNCIPTNWKRFSSTGTDATHFLCHGCNGKNHQDYEAAPVEIKHHLHQQHSLQLVLFSVFGGTRKYPESELVSRITQLISLNNFAFCYWDPKIMSLVIQIISLVRSMDLDSQPKPESMLMSLVALFNSVDLDSLPKPLSKLISLISQKISLGNTKESGVHLGFVVETLELESELITPIYQIASHVISMNSKLKKLISLCPQIQVILEDGKLYVDEEFLLRSSNNKWHCLPGSWDKFSLRKGEDATHFFLSRLQRREP